MVALGRRGVSYERGTPAQKWANELQPFPVIEMTKYSNKFPSVFDTEVQYYAKNEAPYEEYRAPKVQPRGTPMVSLVTSHTNATRIGWHLWQIDLRFAPGLPPGWVWTPKGK